MSKYFKGIVLAGGSGSRLNPITKGVSKQLLPVYDKPMIYHPISVLMLAGIREILVISTPYDIDNYKSLLGDGSEYGIEIQYDIQNSPDGIGQAFLIAKEFIGTKNVALALGDNIFYGQNFSSYLEAAVSKKIGATIFGCYVKDPGRFGVINFDNDFKALSIEEKPKNPKSNYAITGLYFYDNRVVEMAKSLKPSARGELEITEINNIYLKMDDLRVELMPRGFTWLDTGTHDSLLEASNLIKTIEFHKGLKVACLEEIAFNRGWITKEELLKTAAKFNNNKYGEYLRKVINSYNEHN